MTEEQKKILSKWQAQCSRREYCSADVFAKVLKAVDGDREAAQEILEALQAEKYVDDLRYASAFARDKASLSGWGPVKIRFALAGKGIDKTTVDAALGEIDAAGAAGKMENVLRSKYRTLREDPQVRLKLLRFGLSRGYGYEEIRPVVERILAE